MPILHFMPLYDKIYIEFRTNNTLVADKSTYHHPREKSALWLKHCNTPWRMVRVHSRTSTAVRRLSKKSTKRSRSSSSRSSRMLHPTTSSSPSFRRRTRSSPSQPSWSRWSCPRARFREIASSRSVTSSPHTWRRRRHCDSTRHLGWSSSPPFVIQSWTKRKCQYG